ncbi:hypothetical protein GGE65_007745 [Skermanella aerolata]|uniref:hypothetical protein n=1 Tax=Skermanella aerolata TaxID=393310 RepID=UPI003D2556E1
MTRFALLLTPFVLLSLFYDVIDGVLHGKRAKIPPVTAMMTSEFSAPDLWGRPVDADLAASQQL